MATSSESSGTTRSGRQQRNTSTLSPYVELPSDGEKISPRGADADPSDSANEDNIEDGEDQHLIMRIKEGISYVRSLPPGQPPSVQTFFNVPISPENQALALLRKARAAGLVDLISSSQQVERYACGVPPSYLASRSTMDPQWWKPLSRAEIKAGPSASLKDVHDAQKAIKRQAETRRKNPRPLKAAECNLKEALYRQENNMRMYGSRVPHKPDEESPPAVNKRVNKRGNEAEDEGGECREA